MTPLPDPEAAAAAAPTPSSAPASSPAPPSAEKTPPKNSSPIQAKQPGGLLDGLRTLLDRLLVADVFLVLAGALWFGLAVILHSQGVEAPLQAFQGLWQPLFTPAIGVLMAAALLSGALGWWQRRGQR
jgi:hypothetical protein